MIRARNELISLGTISYYHCISHCGTADFSPQRNHADRQLLRTPEKQNTTPAA